MLLHRNAKLGLAGRYALSLAIERGCSMREAGRRHGVSPATACTWSRRWRAASEEERRALTCLFDRSSRPHRSPRMLLLASRRGSARSGAAPGTGRARSPPGSAIRMRRCGRRCAGGGCSRPEPKPREPARRYE
jgi:transposase IS481 family protein